MNDVFFYDPAILADAVQKCERDDFENFLRNQSEPVEVIQGFGRAKTATEMEAVLKTMIQITQQT